ncbi:hypothetical protein CKF59_06870 [Psittacicella gerlachiana]|uniref:Uncharacterized protein n=1 Tax=Psittacicella gerlachiana TaxID=2028574 RepID=A0A3A1Y2W0_9GAMM|nr:hypothetical protein CKF59_06870 [Psittacicella gerlachiana]
MLIQNSWCWYIIDNFKHFKSLKINKIKSCLGKTLYLPEINTNPYLRNPRAELLSSLFTFDELKSLNGDFIYSQAIIVFTNFKLIQNDRIKDKMTMLVDRNGQIITIGKTHKLEKFITSIDPSYAEINLQTHKPNEVLEIYKVFYRKKLIIIDLNQDTLTPGFITPNLKSVANIQFAQCPDFLRIKHAMRECFKSGITSVRLYNDNNFAHSSLSWLQQIEKLRRKIPHLILGVSAKNIDDIDFFGNEQQKSFNISFKQSLDFFIDLEKTGHATYTIDQYSNLSTLSLFLRSHYQSNQFIATKLSVNQPKPILSSQSTSTSQLQKELSFMINLESLSFYKLRLENESVKEENKLQVINRLESELAIVRGKLSQNHILKKYFNQDLDQIQVRNHLLKFNFLKGILINHIGKEREKISKLNFKLKSEHWSYTAQDYISSKFANYLKHPLYNHLFEAKSRSFTLVADFKFFDPLASKEWLNYCNLAINARKEHLPYLKEWMYVALDTSHLQDFKLFKKDKLFFNLEHLTGNDFNPTSLNPSLVRQVLTLEEEFLNEFSYNLLVIDNLDNNHLENRVAILRKYCNDFNFYKAFYNQKLRSPNKSIFNILNKIREPKYKLFSYLNEKVAKAINCHGFIGSLKQGSIANFVILNNECTAIKSTWVNGLCVYR